MPKCALGAGRGFVEIAFQFVPTEPSAPSVLERTVLTFAVPSKPPATATKALVLVAGTATARRPVRAFGKGVVVVQVTLLTSNVTFGTTARFTALLVPPEVLTVTEKVPGTVNELAPLADGTTTTMLESDQAAAFGVIEATTLPWVKTTWPGAP